MFWKYAYANEYMNSWQRKTVLNEALLPEKKELYCSKTMEYITDAEYKHVKESGKNVEHKI